MNKNVRSVLLIYLCIFVLASIIPAIQAYNFTHYASPNIEKTKSENRLTVAQALKIILFGIGNPRPMNKAIPYEHYEDIKLKSNKEIDCWYFKSQDNMGTVIIFHGYSGEKSSMLDKSEAFLDMGYNTLLVDFMGSGASEGNQTTVGYKEAEEVKTCYDYLQARGNKNIFLFGTSMGAAAILKAMNDYNIAAKGIIIECPFGTLYRSVCNRFESMHLPTFPMAGLLTLWGGIENGFWPFSYKPAEYAKQVKCPTLLMYGGRDKKVSKEETDEIYENLSGEKELKIFPDAGHENYLIKYKADWVNTVNDFIDNLADSTYNQFTNKADARNVMKDGKREGKWLEYTDSTNSVTADTSAPGYTLTIYKNDLPTGTVRGYFKNGLVSFTARIIGDTGAIERDYNEDGKLAGVYRYLNGMENGIQKEYYGNGKVSGEYTCTDDSLNGVTKKYYENGALKSVIPYVNNKQDGIEKDYYEDGNLMGLYPYTDNMQNGLAKIYYEDGTLEYEYPYVNDEENGVEKQYYESGELHWELPYTKGIISGMEKQYYEGGVLEGDYTYVNNKQNRITKTYYESGKLESICTCKGDTVNGLEKDYYEDGKLKMLLPCTNGKINGIEKKYYESGNLQAEYIYINGLQTGIAKVYYEGGELRGEYPYSNDMGNGLAREYYKNGKIKRELPLVNEKLNGIDKMYSEKGVLLFETPYTDGMENGVLKEYYPDGMIKEEITCKNGIVNGDVVMFDEKGKIVKEVHIEAPKPGIYHL